MLVGHRSLLWVDPAVCFPSNQQAAELGEFAKINNQYLVRLQHREVHNYAALSGINICWQIIRVAPYSESFPTSRVCRFVRLAR